METSSIACSRRPGIPRALAAYHSPAPTATVPRPCQRRSLLGRQLRRGARHLQQGRLQVQAAASDNNGKDKKEFGQDLDDRILSGEFSDVGSTKERITRPLRKVLAMDPIGPGAALGLKRLHFILPVPGASLNKLACRQGWPSGCLAHANKSAVPIP